MWKLLLFIFLMIAYAVYSSVVYTKGTTSEIELDSHALKKIDRGKILFQQYNCIACHQLYGLGGYLGPELTTAYSDPGRGEMYMRTFLKNGGRRMPDFNLPEDEITAIVAFLQYVDSTAISYKQLAN